MLMDILRGQGARLLRDPRLLKLVQSEHFMKTVVAAMSFPSKLEGFGRDAADKIAKGMRLAREDEVNDLRRTVRALEDEIAEIRRARGAGAP